MRRAAPQKPGWTGAEGVVGSFADAYVSAGRVLEIGSRRTCEAGTRPFLVGQIWRRRPTAVVWSSDSKSVDDTQERADVEVERTGSGHVTGRTCCML